MQGQRGTIGSLPESLAFEHGSASNNARNPPSDYISLSNTSDGFTNTTSQENQNVGLWGESSSSSVQSLMKEPPASMLSLGDVNMNIAHNHTMSPSSFMGIRPTNYASSSSSGPFELEARGPPCKRKAVEPSAPPPSDIIPRLGLSVGGGSNENPVVENTQRNVRLRVNHNVQSNGSPMRSPPVSTAENLLTHESQPALRLPALRRNLQASSRWNRGSSSRTIPSNISDHPIFLQPNESRNAAQNALDLSLTGGGGHISNNGTGVATATAMATASPHRGLPHYPSRRLSEILRRSLLSSIDSGVGGQNSNLFSRIPPPVGAPPSSSTPSPPPPVVGGIQGHHHRQLDGAFGFPHLSRSMVAGSEGRGRLVSEIRNVLDLIRRGEGLRLEDFMILDQTVFYGMADIHDRHRDMRLDIDNMSYEELLALEERIGNVNTGLTEETISTRLKLKTYVTETGQPDAEPCCICQEEYNNRDDLGALECGHDFHTSCIKEWLLQKNLCPVCKSTAFANTK